MIVLILRRIFNILLLFSVPPDPVVIFDENGTRRKTFVGPYKLGDSINLVCDAFGGEYTIYRNRLYILDAHLPYLNLITKKTFTTVALPMS